MSKAKAAREVMVRLIVGAGQASPSPPVGPALGSKGVKSMDFCKEFNALTAHITPGTPIPALITVRPDRTFHFILRTPPTSTLLLAASGAPPSRAGRVRGANAPGRASEEMEADPGAAKLATGKSLAKSAGGGVGAGAVKMVGKTAAAGKAAGAGGGSTQVGEVSLKHVYEIARIKQSEDRLRGLSLESLARSVVAQARSIGVGVVP